MAVVIGLVTIRLYAELVPWGTNPIPWLLAQQPRAVIIGPSGRQYFVRYCDAGAAHSGNHWTWVYTRDPIWGLQIVHGCFMTLDDVREGLEYEGTTDPAQIVFYSWSAKRGGNWVKTTLSLP